ncbi:MAG: transposase [Armatimonadota bacterium]
MLPQTLQEAIVFFSDKQRCHEFMVSLRWSNGPVCPHCGESEKIRFMATRFVYQCNACRKQFTVKVGTIFEDSALGLNKWLSAIWMIANDKNGVSSYELHRAIGITQKSAWFMRHRIRLAMSAGTFEKMSGTVEADEIFIGGKEVTSTVDAKRIVDAGQWVNRWSWGCLSAKESA